MRGRGMADEATWQESLPPQNLNMIKNFFLP